MDFDDLQLEDVVAEAEKKKKRKRKVDSKAKGNRTERNLGKVLKDRFGFEFTRTLGSGNRWGQVFFLPSHAQQTFSGDLVCPENFRFVIECKGGYSEIDLHASFKSGLKEIDEWMEQAEDEAKRCGREPLICWKKNYKPWLAFVKGFEFDHPQFPFCMHYKEWLILPLKELLKYEDTFFFHKMAS